MLSWQKVLLLAFASFSLLISIRGLFECSRKKNAYGITYLLLWLGIFCWGDAVVFGLFWALAALVSFFLHDWLLFLLIIAVFWTVRSLGETIYWFNQQFSVINRYKPEQLPGFRFFKNDSIWFIYQIAMQCVTVISIIASIYFANLWIRKIF
jgi:hypothetical protein